MTNEEVLQKQLDPGQVYIKNKTTGQLDIAGKDEFLNKQAKGTYFTQNNTPTHEIYATPSGSGSQGTNDTTVGDAYKGLIPGTDNSQDAAYDMYGNILKDQTQPYDENTIRQNTMNRFQSEIDALNRMYAEKKAAQLKRDTLAGEGRLGQNAAINARRGLLGSDFGASATDKVNTTNNEIIQGNQNLLDTELSDKVESILGQARQEANDEIKAKQAARISGAKDYIDFLKGAAERKDARISSTLANIYNNDITPNDATFKSLATQLGVSVEDLKGKYKQGKVAYDKANAEAVKPIIVDGVAYERQKNGTYKAVTPGKAESAEWQFVPATKYQQSGYFNKATGEFRPGRAGSVNLGGGIGGGSGVGNGRVNGVVKLSPEVQGWVDLINSGGAKITSVPAKLKTAVAGALASNVKSSSGGSSELKTNALTTAEGLLSKFNDGKGTSAVGKSGAFNSFGYGYIPGTERANFVNDFNSLKSQLSLDNIKLLKGQGAVSDAERALLEKASTKLNLAQSEDEFKTTLEDLVTNLKSEQAPANTVTKPQMMTLPNGTVLTLQSDGTYK